MASVYVIRLVQVRFRAYIGFQRFVDLCSSSDESESQPASPKPALNVLGVSGADNIANSTLR